MRKFYNWSDEVLDELYDEDYNIKHPKVSMGVTYHIVSDSYPYEIVEVINDNKIVVRALKHKSDSAYHGTETNLWSDPNGELITLKRLKYGWKQNSKECGSWSIGKARYFMGWS